MIDPQHFDIKRPGELSNSDKDIEPVEIEKELFSMKVMMLRC